MVVIDLTSSPEPEDESPGKLLKSFQGRENHPTNGRSTPNGRKSVRLDDEDDETPGKLLKSFLSGPQRDGNGQGIRHRGSAVFEEGDARSELQRIRSPAVGGKANGVQQQHHSFSRTNTPRSGTPNGNIARPPQSSPTDPIQSARESFTSALLSKEVQDAIGSPGLALNLNLRKIQREYDEKRRLSGETRRSSSSTEHHEAGLQQRVEKAEAFQKRRLSGDGVRRSNVAPNGAVREGNSLGARHSTAGLRDFRGQGSRESTYAISREPVKQVQRPAGPENESASTRSHPVSLSELLKQNQEKPPTAPVLSGSVPAMFKANGHADKPQVSSTSGLKRTSEAVSSSKEPLEHLKKRRIDVQNTRHALDKIKSKSETKTVLVDVTDPTAERVSLSDEPNIDQTLPKFSADQDTRDRSSSPDEIPARPLKKAKLAPKISTFPTADSMSNASTSAAALGNGLPSQRAEESTKTSAPKQPAAKPNIVPPGAGVHGTGYTTEEDALLKKLKEVDKLHWNEIVTYFNGRTRGSLQVRYSTKVKNSNIKATHASRTSLPRFEARRPAAPTRTDSDDQAPQGRTKRQRKSAPAATDGFVSWTEAREMMRDGPTNAEDIATPDVDSSASAALLQRDTAFSKPISSILRQRELGTSNGSRAWAASRCRVPDEMKNHVFGDYSLRRYYHGTSGDVVGLSWSSTGTHFAAGSIAITDNRSMQYNMSRNLLVGDHGRGELRELVEHHAPRPAVDEAGNPNALHSMRQSQDARLFQTVTSTAFSPRPETEHWLFTAGTDKMLRRYSVETYDSTKERGIERTRCRYTYEHAASVDLLAVHPEGFVATGCHSASGSINIFDPCKQEFTLKWTGSPSRSNLDTQAAIYPSTLKWGQAPAHQKFLLAGFMGDEEKLLAGETALWDIEHQQQIPILGTIRNVFHVAWNPSPSSASVSFAVASNTYGVSVSRGMRTAVRCFAPTETGLKRVLTWECPALDINDVVICPHDDNLVAAGATDGKVYVWDQRWIDRSQKPLHTLCHDESLNVLPHHIDRELTDTGVRFLSWGATKSRLYSGSSDGVVKVWNPHRSANNAHVEDICAPRQHLSAVMSGVFSPDHRDLLIGTENGRINSFSIGGGSAVYKAQQFKLYTAPAPKQDVNEPLVAANELLNSGKIQTKPCGAMPITQVVQAPAYDGPFQAPSQLELASAEEKLESALQAQKDLVSQSSIQNIVSPDEEQLEKAQARVREAQAAIEDLQERADFAETSRPKAEAFQRSLLQSEQSHQAVLEQARYRFGANAKPCELSCGFHGTSEEIEDDGRSELRIPGSLRSICNEVLQTARLAEEDVEDICSRCFPLQAKPNKGAKRHLCLSCKLDSMRLTTVCSKCSAPARVETDKGKGSLCENCAFKCFRCSGPATVSKNADSVTCKACNLAWEAGVLGYELVGSLGRDVWRSRITEHDDQNEDLGTAEREHYASRWEIARDQDNFGY